MVNKRDANSPAPDVVIPDLPKSVPGAELSGFASMEAWDTSLAGSEYMFEDYAVGEKINHVDGMTVEEAEHTIYAWSEVLEKAELSDKVGGLRLRLVAVKDQDPGAFAYKGEDGKYADGVLLDFDYWAAIPRKR